MEQKLKKCRVCGMVKPFDAFFVDNRLRDGRKNICKTCDSDRRRKQKSGGRDVGASTAAVSAAPVASQAGGPVVEASMATPTVLVLQFTDYPHILEKIKNVARDEFRSPEMQAMWVLREWLARTDGTYQRGGGA